MKIKPIFVSLLLLVTCIPTFAQKVNVSGQVTEAGTGDPLAGVFVYVKGENGQLEKREVVTGRYLWSSYVEILDGLTMDDYVAFPYGKTVKDGANAIEATIDELYNEMYY